MSTATQQVFDLPELLELILCQASVPTLLRAQGVNSAFRYTIQDSIHIRRRLWLEPSPQKPGVWHPQYILNRHIDDSRVRRRLGIDRLLNWEWKEQEIIDLYFSSIHALCSLGDTSAEHMILAQPKEGKTIWWSLGYYKPREHGAVTYGEHRKFWIKGFPDRMPTLGNLREVIMEKYGFLTVSDERREEAAGEEGRVAEALRLLIEKSRKRRRLAVVL